MKQETVYQYTVIFIPAEEGGYVAEVPMLPGCVTEGDTLEEAREMAKDAIVCYLESLAKDGEEIPMEPPCLLQEKLCVSLSPAA